MIKIPCGCLFICAQSLRRMADNLERLGYSETDNVKVKFFIIWEGIKTFAYISPLPKKD